MSTGLQSGTAIAPDATNEVQSTPTLATQGIMGHVYGVHQLAPEMYGTDHCTPVPPMYEKMANVRLAVVGPETFDVIAETISNDDGSYQVDLGLASIGSVSRVKLACQKKIRVSSHKYVVEDVEIGMS